MGMLSVVSSLFEPAVKLIDEMHTSGEEKLQAKAVLYKIKADADAKAEEFEMELLQAKATIITTEANSQSFLARNWRPMTMVAFVIAVMSYWFGLTPPDLPLSVVDQMFELVKIGIGGYIAGRSGEKIAQSVASVMKDRQ